MLPKSNRLEEWFSDSLLVEIDSEAFAMESHPYEYKVIQNVFREEVFVELCQLSQLTDAERESLHPTGYYYSTFASPEFVKFIYGEPYRNFLKVLTGLSLNVSSKFPVPQLCVFTEQRTGLDVHTDEDSGIDISSIFYIHDFWDESFGGHLGIYEKETDTYKAHKKIAPTPNTMVFLKISRNSHHGIDPLRQEWARKTIITDWKAAEKR